MRNLPQDPLYRPEDLGSPIPDSEHAVSVALPLWEHIVAYEEKDPAVVEKMKCGYPRFLLHPRVLELFAECTRRFAGAGEKSMAFPSARVAERCLSYIQKIRGSRGRIDPLGVNGIYSTTFPESALETAALYWRYSGEIVSSRLAQATLHGYSPARERFETRQTLRERIARLADQNPEDVYLFSSGMAAMFCTQRLVQALNNAVTIQLEFPYVDVLRVQKEFGPGAIFIPRVGRLELDQIKSELKNNRLSAVYCEIPSNPLLRTVDLERLAAILREYSVPLIVDDTIGSSVNLNTAAWADLITTSLTKFFAGQGDVMAGSLVVNRQSPFYAKFKEFLGTDYEDLLWTEDAAVLEEESRDFPERMKRINATAEAVFDCLSRHPKIERAWYPQSETREAYDKIKKPGGGYGGLMSILLKNAERSAPVFYDALRVCKGPSLGTNYTLVCPYTLLAHYDELEWAEQCGISRWLIRISVGLEEADDLIRRFEEALEKA